MIKYKKIGLFVGASCLWLVSALAWGRSLLPFIHIFENKHIFNPPAQLPEPVSSNVLPFKAHLSTYTVPSALALLNEAGLPPDFGPQVALDHLNLYLNPGGAPFLKFTKKCTELGVHPRLDIFPMSKETFACAPWWLQARQIQRALASKKAVPPPQKRRLDYRRFENWERSKDLTFSENLSSLALLKKEDFDLLLKQLGNTPPNCLYEEAYAALTSRAETYFPEPEALGFLTTAYSMANACLKPTSPHWERTHLRVGLHLLMAGLGEPAGKSLALALEGGHGKEQFRSLFWLGAIEAGAISKLGPSEVEKLQDNAHWQTLLRDYPLSIHAIMASHIIGKDPKGNLISDTDLALERRQQGGWTEYNVMAFVFEFLRAHKPGWALQEWSRFVGRNSTPLAPEAHLFLALHHHAVGNYRLAILGMSRYLRLSESERVSLKFLDLFFPRPYTDQVLELAQDVDPVLLLSLIRQESAFDPRARSSANARGLMQVLPSTANLIMPISPEDLYNPELNIKAGVGFFKRMLSRYNGRVEHVLGAYNAGPTPVDRWLRRLPDANIMLFADLVPFSETRNYISIILRNAYWYGRLLVLHDDGHAKTLQQKSAAARWRSDTVGDLLKVAWGQQEGQVVMDKVVRFGDLKVAADRSSLAPAGAAATPQASPVSIPRQTEPLPAQARAPIAPAAPKALSLGERTPVSLPPNPTAFELENWNDQ